MGGVSFCYWFGVAKKPRVFDRLECKNCVFKGGSYCWNQCPYNIWRKR